MNSTIARKYQSTSNAHIKPRQKKNIKAGEFCRNCNYSRNADNLMVRCTHPNRIQQVFKTEPLEPKDHYCWLWEAQLKEAS